MYESVRVAVRLRSAGAVEWAEKATGRVQASARWRRGEEERAPLATEQD